MHINGIKACLQEGTGHLVLAVNALLSQNRNFRTNAGVDKRSSEIFFRIKAHRQH